MRRPIFVLLFLPWPVVLPGQAGLIKLLFGHQRNKHHIEGLGSVQNHHRGFLADRSGVIQEQETGL